MTTKNSQDINAKQIELQVISQQINQIQQQLQQVEMQIMDLTATVQGIDDLTKSKLDSEVLAPLNAGIYVKTKLKDNKTLLVNVGAGVTVEKTAEQVKEILKNQLTELNEYQQKMLQEFQKMTTHAQKLEAGIK